jgi:uncharacterized protein YggE
MRNIPRAAASMAGLAALVAGAGPALAQPMADDARFAATTLDISAEGEARVAPDMATITLGVSHQAPSAQAAMAAVNADMGKVVDAIRGAGIEARQIQTSAVNLNPQYVYEPNKPARLTGYTASNEVRVTVLDLARLGPTLDAVVGAGATNVGQVSFGLRSRVAAENAARLAAVKALDDKATLYADAAGYHVKRLVSLSEGGGYVPGPPVPLFRAQAMAAAAPTPVETGELDVKITVSGEFELTH